MQGNLQPFFITTLPPEAPLTLKSQVSKVPLFLPQLQFQDAFKLLSTSKVPYVFNTLIFMYAS